MDRRASAYPCLALGKSLLTTIVYPLEIRPKLAVPQSHEGSWTAPIAFNGGALIVAIGAEFCVIIQAWAGSPRACQRITCTEHFAWRTTRVAVLPRM